MLTSVFAKAVRDRALFTASIVGITLVWLAFGMGVYSGFDDEALSFVKDMPEALQAMYGGSGGTSAEIIGGTMFGMLAPAMLLVFTSSATQPTSNSAAINRSARAAARGVGSSPGWRSGVLIRSNNYRICHGL